MDKPMHALRKELRYYKMLVKMFLSMVHHRNVIVHFGHVSRGRIAQGNVGDPVLYAELERLISSIEGENYYWLPRSIIFHEVCWPEVWLYNHFASAIIVGGHGLLMIDTGRNTNSGWQFNITIKNLARIRIPLSFVAIGFNTFRGQDDFIEVFKKHINLCVKKSKLFGLRNYGSIEALKPYLTEENKSKLCFQPCPTTMLALYEDLPSVEKKDEIAVCLAFDRYEHRFGDCFDRIFENLISFAHNYEGRGYQVVFYIHNPIDLKHPHCKRFQEAGYKVQSISGMSFDDIFAWYMQKKLVVGMRGHSLMIPWGLRTPVVSLTTQNKQKWFIETTNHPERSIEVSDPNMLYQLEQEVNFILSNYDEVVDDIILKQQEFYRISKMNIMKLFMGGGKSLTISELHRSLPKCIHMQASPYNEKEGVAA